MSEPIEAITLDDLGEVVVTVPIPRPDGRIINVKLRTLGHDEVWQIRSSIDWPDAPITDYQKIGGEALPVRDYQNKDYLKKQREADRELSYCNIAASLVMDIPGETLKNKGRAIEQKIGRWAFDYVLGVINRFNVIEQEAIDQVVNSFRYQTPDRTSGDGRGQPESRTVAELVEG